MPFDQQFRYRHALHSLALSLHRTALHCNSTALPLHCSRATRCCVFGYERVLLFACLTDAAGLAGVGRHQVARLQGALQAASARDQSDASLRQQVADLHRTVVAKDAYIAQCEQRAAGAEEAAAARVQRLLEAAGEEAARERATVRAPPCLLACVLACVLACMLACLCACLCACLYACILCLFVCLHVRLLLACLCACLYVCLLVCLCVCLEM